MFGSSMRKNAAFTLAEVLITLGILGIVAEMTIPTLLNNVHKQEYVVRLQKFYTTQMDGWSQLLAGEGVQQLEDTSAFQSMGSSSCSVSEDADTEFCKPFFNALKKYFRVSVVTAPSYKIKFLKGVLALDYTGQTVLVFADGSVMLDGYFVETTGRADSTRQAQISAGGGHMYSYQGALNIDLNGFKKPNIMGRDIFSFYLSGDGKLYPVDGKDESLYYSGDLRDIWQTQTETCGAAGSTNVSSADGSGCTARIMDEGWQMNY